MTTHKRSCDSKQRDNYGERQEKMWENDRKSAKVQEREERKRKCEESTQIERRVRAGERRIYVTWN